MLVPLTIPITYVYLLMHVLTAKIITASSLINPLIIVSPHFFATITYLILYLDFG